ncbi:DUF3883 domain-containing protein [Streptomyces sp. NBC_00582]|uniref:DUF3883 domain-containing protein n=1 Tax=Streptomyces sp. NBC_00582 TaxID=2975783 RepID=UPI002E81ECB6|nr:DUF3883 domain-containing protein [Streptomyces sp. NBC_00582]WUB64319.1 DUF3883 domain-containing protein [Streptomyces sp. NBC_00582]
MALGEGTLRAARRWLEQLQVAEISRARALFTHHPDYADLTPVQYADGLAWLLRSGLVSADGRPNVKVGVPERRGVAGGRWTLEAETRRREIGAAGERAIVRLVEQGGSLRVTHVAAWSDAYGYDVEVESTQGAVSHIEVKATTDPTRLRFHLTRHEFEVMRRDPDWVLVTVLIDVHGGVLAVATVSRDWLKQAAPADRTAAGRWESAHFVVPDHALAVGVLSADGRRLDLAVDARMPVWGLSYASSTQLA